MKTLSLLVLLLALSACSVFSPFAGSMANCEDVGVKLELPAYATVLEERCSLGSGPGNAAYRAKITIAPGDLAAFQALTGLTDWSTSAADARVYDDEAAGLGSLLVAHYGDGAYEREVLIDMTDTQRYTVSYYHAFID